MAASMTCIIDAMSVGNAFLILLLISFFTFNPILQPIEALYSKNCKTAILTSLSQTEEYSP